MAALSGLDAAYCIPAIDILQVKAYSSKSISSPHHGYILAFRSPRAGRNFENI